jgi:RNA polymerase sigma-32 factor
MAPKKVAKKKTAVKKKASKKAAIRKSSSARKKTSSRSVQAKLLEPEIAEEQEILEPEIIDVSPIEDDGDTAAVAAAEPSTALTPTDPLAKYMSEIRRYPLLTREEEERLAKLYYETGDKSAAETLVTSNLRFVVKIAAEYSKFGAKLIDLIQEGNVGLMHAVKEFNPYKGVKLITYAVWWIRGYIQEFLMRQYSMVRIGTTANQRKLFYQLQKQREELERMGLDQGVALLSGKLGIPEDEIKVMHQRMSGRDLSLDQPLSSGEGSSLMDFQSDSSPENGIDESLGHQEELHILEENIESIRKELNPRELYLLDERLLSDEPKTLQEIGDHFGVTREAVRQMENRVMKKLRAQMLAKMHEDPES